MTLLRAITRMPSLGIFQCELRPLHSCIQISRTCVLANPAFELINVKSRFACWKSKRAPHALFLANLWTALKRISLHLANAGRILSHNFTLSVSVQIEHMCSSVHVMSILKRLSHMKLIALQPSVRPTCSPSLPLTFMKTEVKRQIRSDALVAMKMHVFSKV